MEKSQTCARVIRDGAIVFSGKLEQFSEKNQTKQVSAGLECGIQSKILLILKKDIIEAYNSTITERRI